MIAAAFLTSAMSVDKTLEIGKVAPKIETISGSNVVNDADSNGKSKLISFWNPKKPGSRISNRNLSREYGENAAENVEFISICTDTDEELMKEVVKLDGLSTQNLYSYSEISPRVFKDFDVENNPRAFLISSEGKILKIY